MGTPGFMAPEQYGFTQATDLRADVFGVGATLYALILGRAPFYSQDPIETKRFQEICNKTLNDSPDFDALNAPASLIAILKTCLAKNPSDRYQKLEDVARQLQELKDVVVPAQKKVTHAVLPDLRDSKKWSKIQDELSQIRKSLNENHSLAPDELDQGFSDAIQQVTDHFRKSLREITACVENDEDRFGG